MKLIQRIASSVFVVFSCVGCDQITKSVARHSLQELPPISYYHGLLRLQFVENRGAFLSMGANIPDHLRFALFTVATALLMISLLIYLLVSTTLTMTHRVALTLIISGGIGNLYDRVVNNGAVTDFLNIGIGGVRTGVFNVADVYITVGTILLFICTMRRREEGATVSQG